MNDPLPFSTIVRTRPPAKLNLFLELLGKRDDGFHDIDTVMVPIDWCDHLSLERTQSDSIELSVRWMPSQEIIACQMGVTPESEQTEWLAIPADDRNLVFRALEGFRNRFDLPTGFRCELLKSIPAGAGMGGASSDAAAALRCAAILNGISPNHSGILELAAGLGSDVPFFLGPNGEKSRAARATGRGEHLSQIASSSQFDIVVVFPAVSLSTARVYSVASIPDATIDSAAMIVALEAGLVNDIAFGGLNRLQEPASKTAPEIDEILKSMWRSNLLGCQLTGSGSACFGFARSTVDAKRVANQLRSQYYPGLRVSHCRQSMVPSQIEMSSNC
ncbi:4-diphosphocytidyl-2-C-methyl-D-erythritol kinase [Novipirellula aureliae]|uniref:4-diphosphocytidyl-2-C-methyl-D-erythritol kinase n=1 Tax=Novipirellula aureliae TaxID=2527966 RepID=A0A5C6DJS3_9BACT|nr:4-(cytidine 5'-diphospho)-2-C-methyl-D-erythritol kinase [Novipirellula aureliae]TWU35831.1 4-diphosphocytidyl-2-C-methyl-D-erythritol kinase [Novipirellula aureliae]